MNRVRELAAAVGGATVAPASTIGARLAAAHLARKADSLGHLRALCLQAYGVVPAINAWLTPLTIIDGGYVRFGMQMSF